MVGEYWKSQIIGDAPRSQIHIYMRKLLTRLKNLEKFGVSFLLACCSLRSPHTTPFLLLCSYLLCFCFSTLFFYFWDFFSLPSFMVVIHFCNLVVSSLFYSLFLRGGVVYKQTRKTGHKGDQGSVSESFKRERDHVAENCCPSQCDY